MTLGERVTNFFFPIIIQSELDRDLKRSQALLAQEEIYLRETGDASGYMRALEADNALYKVGPPPQISGNETRIQLYNLPREYGLTRRINCLPLMVVMTCGGCLGCAALTLLTNIGH